MASGMKFETLLVNVVKGYYILWKIHLMRQTTLYEGLFYCTNSETAITHTRSKVDWVRFSTRTTVMNRNCYYLFVRYTFAQPFRE